AVQRTHRILAGVAGRVESGAHPSPDRHDDDPRKPALLVVRVARATAAHQDPSQGCRTAVLGPGSPRSGPGAIAGGPMSGTPRRLWQTMSARRATAPLRGQRKDSSRHAVERNPGYPGATGEPTRSERETRAEAPQLPRSEATGFVQRRINLMTCSEGMRGCRASRS